MKKACIVILSMLLLAACCVLAGCGAGALAYTYTDAEQPSATENAGDEQTGDNVFYATVLELQSDFGGILVKPESDVLPNELVIHSSAMPTVSVGDRVRVEHNGQITLSLPGQIFGATVTVVS